jgi:hypothetical protein
MTMNTARKERVLSSKTRNSLNKHTETENGFTEKQLRELQEMLAKYDSDFSRISEYEKNFLTLRAHAPVVPSEHTLELKKKTRKFSINAVFKFCFQRKPKIEVNLDDFSSVHSAEINNVSKQIAFAFSDRKLTFQNFLESPTIQLPENIFLDSFFCQRSTC